MISYSIGNGKAEVKIVAPPDFGADGKIWYYEPEVVSVIAKFVKEGDFAIDAGANLGFFTLILSAMVGKSGLVMAFEPDPTAFAELNKNVAANNLSNVVCSDTALFNEDGEREFWLHPVSGYSSFGRYDESSSVKVQTRKLDSILHGFSTPRFLKLDCEGAEFGILQGAEKTLRNGVDCVVIELNYALMEQFHLSSTAVREFMESLGYHMFIISVKDPTLKDYQLIRVEPGQSLTVRGNHADRVPSINVMFSKQRDPMATER
jgi:FkbM family methyltransferase